MSLVSKIPKSEQREKLAKHKLVANLSSKAKCLSTVEDKRTTERISNTHKAGNSKSSVISSKVPVRLETRASSQTKHISAATVNKNSNKNKCLMHNKRIAKKFCNDELLDSHLSRNKSCSMEINSIPKCHNVINSFESQSITNCLSTSEKDEKKLHAKHTIQPKRMLPNKGILKEYCHKVVDLNIRHSSEGDLVLDDSKLKSLEKEKNLKSRKVTFKNLSSNDLLKISEENSKLMEAVDKNKSFTPCELDINESFIPKEARENTKSQYCNEENDCTKQKILSTVSPDIIRDKSEITPENSSDENIQGEKTKPQESDFKNSSIKTEILEDFNLETVANGTKSKHTNINNCKLLFSDFKNESLPVEETSNDKNLGRRQLIQKQIDEKIEILTAEFLKYIKEKKRRHPRSMLLNKAKSKNASWEGNKSQDSCSTVKPSLLDLTNNKKDNNDKIQNREDETYKFTSHLKSRENETLANKVEKWLPDCHHSKECNTDLNISPMSSRIPRPTNSKKESPSAVISVNLNMDSEVLEKRKILSSSRSQSLQELQQNKTKYFHSQDENFDKIETEKTGLLSKEFESLRNACDCDLCEVVMQSENIKISHSGENFKKSINSENLLTCENYRNSLQFHGTKEHKDKEIVKKLNSGAKFIKDETKCRTKFKNHSNEIEEKEEENFCRKPSNNIISLESHKENRPKNYLPLENKTHLSNSIGEESGNENILQYEDKENIKYESSMELLFSQRKKKILCFMMIFVFSTLLLVSVYM